MCVEVWSLEFFYVCGSFVEVGWDEEMGFMRSGRVGREWDVKKMLV